MDLFSLHFIFRPVSHNLLFSYVHSMLPKEEALDALKRDHAKKSAMARTLLSEREEEVICTSIIVLFIFWRGNAALSYVHLHPKEDITLVFHSFLCLLFFRLLTRCAYSPRRIRNYWKRSTLAPRLKERSLNWQLHKPKEKTCMANTTTLERSRSTR